MSKANRDRAMRAQLALLAHQKDDFGGSAKRAMDELKAEPKEVLKYLLADLRHWCDHLGFDFAKIDREAYQAYLEDKWEARQARREKAKVRR